MLQFLTWCVCFFFAFIVIFFFRLYVYKIIQIMLLLLRDEKEVKIKYEYDSFPFGVKIISLFVCYFCLWSMTYARPKGNRARLGKTFEKAPKRTKTKRTNNTVIK